MLILRLLVLLALIAIAGGLAAYALTRDRRYLAFAWRVLQVTVVFALILFALLALERFGVALIPL